MVEVKRTVNSIRRERQRALYGVKYVLSIFWQTWLDILRNKKKLDAL
jgi:hypothetical protein